MESDVYGIFKIRVFTPVFDVYGIFQEQEKSKGTTFAKPPKAAEKIQKSDISGKIWKILKKSGV